MAGWVGGGFDFTQRFSAILNSDYREFLLSNFGDLACSRSSGTPVENEAGIFGAIVSCISRAGFYVNSLNIPGQSDGSSLFSPSPSPSPPPFPPPFPPLPPSLSLSLFLSLSLSPWAEFIPEGYWGIFLPFLCSFFGAGDGWHIRHWLLSIFKPVFSSGCRFRGRDYKYPADKERWIERNIWVDLQDFSFGFLSFFLFFSSFLSMGEK